MTLLQQVRSLLRDAAAAYAGAPEQARLLAALARLDEPLRVALAGRLKAGKSTLLNALVGERLAATDATECTRIVTWYANGVASRAWAYPHEGEPRQLRFSRENGQSSVQLGDFAPEDLDRLVIEVPNSRLDRMTLIDTPGIGSLSTDISSRTTSFMNPGSGDPDNDDRGSGESGSGESDPGADAVLYLMRHLHASDVGFLEAFHDEHLVGSTPVTAIGVLSRADEIGAGRPDALDVAGQIAADYRRDARVRALVQTVIPVAGLLAEASATLTESDHATLVRLASAATLLSSDRFLAAGGSPALLERMGLFGIRLAVELIRLGLAEDAVRLSAELQRRSGLEELRSVLLTQFAGRRAVLKAQHAIRVLEGVLDARPNSQEPRLRRRVEALMAGAHDFAELRFLNDLRTGVVDLKDDDLRLEAEILLGATGDTARARIGLGPTVPDGELRPALLAVLHRWQRLEASPVADMATRRTAAVVRRSLEGFLVSGPDADG